MENHSPSFDKIFPVWSMQVRNIRNHSLKLCIACVGCDTCCVHVTRSFLGAVFPGERVQLFRCAGYGLAQLLEDA